jgi:long-chain acyl-CoA synthetase
VAFVVARKGSDLSENSLKAFSLENAPAYQHPRSIWFLDSLPLASTNKVDRNALRELATAKLMRGTASTAQSLNGRQNNTAWR